MADDAIAARLAAALAPADIPVAPAVDGLPVIEKMADSLAAAIAGPEAWPLVIRLEPGFATRPPLAWEVELITACLRDVVSRVARAGDRR